MELGLPVFDSCVVVGAHVDNLVFGLSMQSDTEDQVMYFVRMSVQWPEVLKVVQDDIIRHWAVQM